MKVLFLNPGADTAGLSYGMKLALEADGRDEARVVTQQKNYIAYPIDARWDLGLVRELYDWCDVVMIGNSASTYLSIDTGQHKPVVIYHHGTMFRTEPDETWAMGEAIGAVQAVSTVDLLLSVPEGKHAFWIPQVIDVDRMVAIRNAEYRPSRKVVVAHAPTNRTIKGTEALLGAFRRATRKVDYLDLVLIEWATWEACLRKKATADIFADQFSLGYGLNTVEAWAMGIPVMAGASPVILDRMREEYGTSTLPFMETAIENIEANLLELAASADLRSYYAKLGRAHVRKFHSQAAVAARLRDIFSSIPRSTGVPEAAERVAVG